MSSLTAPQITRYKEYFGQFHRGFGASGFGFDAQSSLLWEELFRLLLHIEPDETGARRLWLRARRGPIKDFGDFDALLAEGQVSDRNEFENWWQQEFPHQVCWFQLTARENSGTGYRSIILENSIVFEELSSQKSSTSHNATEFIQWLIDGVKTCLDELRAGVYQQHIEQELPYRKRIGTIRREQLWKIYLEQKAAFFMGISPEEIKLFFALTAQQRDGKNPCRPLLTGMTANDFYGFCALGYRANHYSGLDLSPKDQYAFHADGRDDGLSEITGNSEEAFSDWYHARKQTGGHPWEVCRGGSDTHISLFVVEKSGGYELHLEGSSYPRTIETIKFYLALKGAGLPVYLHNAQLLAARLKGEEKVGIVPDSMLLVGCESLFPEEHISEFIHFPTDKESLVMKYAQWKPLPIVQFKEWALDGEEKE